MSILPMRLSELQQVNYDSIDGCDSNVSSEKEPTKPIKLIPKRLHELYLDSFDSEFEDSIDCAAESDRSSGFDENRSEAANEVSREVSSSTPLGKENDRNYCNEKIGSSERCPFTERVHDKNFMVGSKATGPVKAEIPIKQKKCVSFSPLEPRELLFSPIESRKAISKQQTDDVQSVDSTPSIKPPLTTGRIIFSSSQRKQQLPRPLNSDYKKTLFTTPQQPLVNRLGVSNTSDYVTDSFNSIKKTSFVLSPIDEEKISIDDFHALSATNDDGTAVMNKILEINRKDFTIKKKIGSGGSCIVHLVQCKNSGRECTLKVVNLKTDASNVESYLNETKLLQKLQGNDVGIYN